MILAILQARVSSTRLPGKVLKLLLNKPMLVRQIERIKRSKLIDMLVIATSVDPLDDLIELLCNENNMLCFRGSLSNVLDRFYQAALVYKPDHIIRLTGDCPLIDPIVIDYVVQFYLKGNFDYASNTVKPSFPDGLDVEIFSYQSLKKSWYEAELPSEKEHVTSYILAHSKLFKIGNFSNAIDLSKYRWTVDEKEDFELVTKIYEALYPGNAAFNTNDILNFLEKNFVLKKLNSNYRRNEGYKKSLQDDLLYHQKRS